MRSGAHYNSFVADAIGNGLHVRMSAAERTLCAWPAVILSATGRPSAFTKRVDLARRAAA